MPTIPSIELVLDRSGSMGMSDISPTRYKALQTALFGATGAVTTKEAAVYFGEELFSGDRDRVAPMAHPELAQRGWFLRTARAQQRGRDDAR